MASAMTAKREAAALAQPAARTDAPAAAPTTPGEANRADGAVRLAFAADAERAIGPRPTRLAELYHRQPLRVLRPVPAADDLTAAVIACISGGLCGGDRLTVKVCAGPGSGAQVSGQAPEKAYRSLGATARIEADLAAGAGALLEWLPQEMIVFDGARVRRETSIRLSDGAAVLAGEMTVLGRHARGEAFCAGALHDGWRVFGPNGRLVWRDAFRLEGDAPAGIADPARLAGARALATIVLAAPEAAAHLEGVRGRASAAEDAGAGTIGVSLVNDLLIVRMIGSDVLALRGAFADLWRTLRRDALALPARMPRLWSI